MITLGARLAVAIALASGVTFVLENVGLLAAMIVWIAIDAAIGLVGVELD